MTKNTVHDPAQHLKESDKDWDIFQYAYQFTLKDKIYISTIKDKSIVDLCLKGSNTKKYNSSLAGDIKSEYRVTDEEAILKTIEELKLHISNIQNNMPVNNIQLSNNFDNDLWVNRQRPNEFNPTHNHNGILSFVIYADIPEEIRQEHKQAVGNSPSRGLIQFNSEFANSTLIFNPSTYNILIFESSHIHQVYPFYSDNTRITIAGNIHLIE